MTYIYLHLNVESCGRAGRPGAGLVSACYIIVGLKAKINVTKSSYNVVDILLTLVGRPGIDPGFIRDSFQAFAKFSLTHVMGGRGLRKT